MLFPLFFSYWTLKSILRGYIAKHILLLESFVLDWYNTIIKNAFKKPFPWTEMSIFDFQLFKITNLITQSRSFLEVL